MSRFMQRKTRGSSGARIRALNPDVAGSGWLQQRAVMLLVRQHAELAPAVQAAAAAFSRPVDYFSTNVAPKQQVQCLMCCTFGRPSAKVSTAALTGLPRICAPHSCVSLMSLSNQP
jgi:hypothetical protein